MKDREKIFRAYDIRGTYPDQLHKNVVRDLAIVITAFFPKRGRVLIGRDARKSSPALLKELEKGLLERGARVYNAGLITSPQLVFLVRSKKMDGGVIVTASHNPPQYNGLKVVDKNGVAISGEQIEKKLTNSRGLPKKTAKRKSINIHEDAIRSYGAFLGARANLKKDVRVVFDALHGAVGPIIKNVCSKQKHIIPIYLNLPANGKFPPQGPDPTYPQTQKLIRKEIIKQRADAGILFDGDGDRMVLLDEKGNVVRPEYVWRMLFLGMKAKKTVYATPLAWMMGVLSQELRSLGVLLSVEQSKVGHSFMVKKMRAIDGDIGVEQSGHYYFKDFFYAGSGILAALYALNVLSRLPYTLSVFSSLLPASHRPSERGIKKRYDMKKMYILFKKMLPKNTSLSSLDGISGWMGDGWFNVRSSNTQLRLRINVEAATKKEAESIYQKILTVIRKCS